MNKIELELSVPEVAATIAKIEDEWDGPMTGLCVFDETQEPHWFTAEVMEPRILGVYRLPDEIKARVLDNLEQYGRIAVDGFSPKSEGELVGRFTWQETA